MITADSVFVNGIVVTVDQKNSFKKAIAVKDGKIIDVGENEDIKSYIGSETKVIDLGGKMILPAAYDAHCHGVSMGGNSLMANFSYPEVNTIGKVRERLAAAAMKLPKGSWIRGYGLDDDNLEEYRTDPNRMITHADFDDVCPDNPVKIGLWSGHGAFLNQKALEICGITDDTPDPVSGKIVRDKNGEATGLLMEGGGLNLVEKFIPQFTDEEIETAILNFQKLINSEGYTGYTEATLGPADNRNSGISSTRALYAYKRLADQGKLTARVSLGYYAGNNGVQTSENVEQTINEFPFADYNKKPDYMKFNLIKLFCDGVHLGYTAWMMEDYADNPGTHGHSCFLGPEASDDEQKAELQRIINVAHRKGFQIAVHAIGDRAVKTCVDCLANAIQMYPRADVRHYVLHADSLGDNATAAKAAKFGILYSVQPGLMDYLIEPSMPRVGVDKGARMMGLREYLNIGVMCCGGSDAISGAYQNWRQAVQSAVTRRSKISGKVYHPELAISVMDGIRLFTINAAYQEHCERTRGSIEIGKFADFQVLDKNIFNVDPEEIGSVQVVETYMDGKLIYKA